MEVVASSRAIKIPVIPVLVSRSRSAIFLHCILSGTVVSVIVLLPGVLGRTVIVPVREFRLWVHALLWPLRPPVVIAV